MNPMRASSPGASWPIRAPGSSQRIAPKPGASWARASTGRIRANRGAGVITGDSAEAGRQLVAREHPDVLVADIGMPEEDGYSLIRTIRSLPAAQGGSVPAAAVTALARSEDRRRALLAWF